MGPGPERRALVLHKVYDWPINTAAASAWGTLGPGTASRGMAPAHQHEDRMSPAQPHHHWTGQELECGVYTAQQANDQVANSEIVRTAGPKAVAGGVAQLVRGAIGLPHTSP